MTVREILQRSASRLAADGFVSARLEAELLLGHVLGVGRLDLLADRDRVLSAGERAAFEALVTRRADGEPVAYLLGEREFYGLAFEVSRDVLVPRPETELIVDRVLALQPARLVDLGTGCGAIAVACSVHLPGATVTATDVSEAALAIARRNAARHGVARRIRFLSGDLFDALPEYEPFDVIACNPPYVREGDAAAVARHEPAGALFGGPDGLAHLRRLIEGAPARLRPGGTLLAEIAEEQAATVEALASGRFARVAVHRDLAGLPRLLEAVVVADQG